MAKQYDFQPDKPYATWLSRLQLTRLQQKQVLKWALYALILLILSLVQDVVLCRFRLFGGTTDLVPCGIFIICILEGTQQSCVFSLVSAFLYLLSGMSPGSHVLILITALAMLAAAIRQTYLRPSLLSTLLTTLFSMGLYELAVFAFCLLLGKVSADRLVAFLIPAGLSVVIVPFVYPIAKAISTIGGTAWKE